MSDGGRWGNRKTMEFLLHYFLHAQIFRFEGCVRFSNYNFHNDVYVGSRKYLHFIVDTFWALNICPRHTPECYRSYKEKTDPVPEFKGIGWQIQYIKNCGLRTSVDTWELFLKLPFSSGKAPGSQWRSKWNLKCPDFILPCLVLVVPSKWVYLLSLVHLENSLLRLDECIISSVEPSLNLLPGQELDTPSLLCNTPYVHLC